ncbi:MAG: sensor histidine kinase, partial [Aedoeadaptatus pacaensis]
RNIRSNRFNPATKILQWDPLIFESDGKVWQIKIIYHGLVKETLIYNITLEWALYEEIKKISEANRRMNADLKAYQEKIGEYTRQKENLQAKIKIHDRLGQSLIYFRRYLEKADKTPEDRIRLETLWRESLLLFEEKKEAPKEPSSWDKLISTAKAIGVEVIAEGGLPEGEQDRRLLVDFVHEAMNNAIRHGRAKKIRITLKDDGPTFRCRIVNDGLPPQGPIEEKGGLKNMRQRLAYYGGELSVNTDEGFQLDLSWTKGGYRDL